MKITDIITQNNPSLSFEIFPPKNSANFDSVMDAATQMVAINPSYMSVTYGAGGTTAGLTVDIAKKLKQAGVTPLAHLSCISADKAAIRQELDRLRDNGIENVLALRGDLPTGFDSENLHYRYASELMQEIRDYGDFCIGGACYPECHPESESISKDLESLKIKVESGCQFLTTQMFFDNDILYNFLYRLSGIGVNVPVVAGIMPVTNAAQIKRICSISGNALPQRFLRIVDRYGDQPAAMKQAGIAFACEQIIDLYANGINAVHIYTMNKPDVAKAIKDNVSEIIK